MRKLATVRKIDALEPIDGADLIETATIGGWKVVVKKGEFSVGQLAVYFEIDSWIPNALAPFLTSENKEPREYNDIKGERLRTVRLRKQLSQGLLLPINVVYDGVETKLKELGVVVETIPLVIEEDMDVSDLLNIHKYEPPMSAQLAGMAKGNFPIWGRKTDQPRCQNLKYEIEDAYNNDCKFEITIKLDGSSMSVGRNNEDLVVCSRNLSLKLDQENNAFVDAANKANLLEKLTNYGKNIFISSELMGPGIQKNRENFGNTQFFVYDILDVDTREYIPGEIRRKITQELGLQHVPVLYESITLKELGLDSIDKILAFAEGISINAKTREGVVFKSIDGLFSFKAISNSFLLKEES
jgi:RNA ligase (TIGR02306 family)